MNNPHLIETLARALSVDLGAHCITELVHAAADRIEKLKSINGGLRKWQDVARPKLEARIAELKAHSNPRLIDEAPQDGSEVLAWVPHLGWAALSWSNVSDCWVGHGREYPTHWVYLPGPVDDTYSRGATP